MTDIQPPQDDIQTAQDKIIRAFQFFEDWMERYQYLIDLGRKLPSFPEVAKTDHNRLWGCQSLVWFIFKKEDGRLYFQAVSVTVSIWPNSYAAVATCYCLMSRPMTWMSKL